MEDGGTVGLAPITSAELEGVGDFLHRELNARLSAREWAAAVVPPWTVDDAPNHGFLLREDDRVVGVYLAFYSTRVIAGREERICNLAAWCVLESHRVHSVRLLRAMLGQRGYTFTDLSPSGNVVALNRRLKFADLDTSQVLVPNLPWPVRRRGVRVVSRTDEIDRLLTGADLVRSRDHRAARAARQLVLVEGDRTCHVVFRRDRRKQLPLFVSILHVSDRELFGRHQGLVFARLLRHGALATLAELRVVGDAPSRGRRLASPRPKMFRSETLSAGDIDYLYSELTCVAW
jgi:hypothetical protein